MKRGFLFILLFSLLLIGAPRWSTQARHASTVTLTVHEGADFKKTTRFSIPADNAAGGVTVDVADLGDDGIPEILVGNGTGNEPRVRVLRKDGSEIGSFLAYKPQVNVGLNLVTCDVDGDDKREIITAPQRRGGPHVRIFSSVGELESDFFAYNGGFRGGVRLACGNLDADKADELVTLPGPGGGPHVRIWKGDGADVRLAQEFFAFSQSDRSGLVGGVINKHLVVTQAKTRTPTVKRYRIGNDVAFVGAQTFGIEGLGITSVFANHGTTYLATTSPAQIYNLADGRVVPIASATSSVTAVSADLNTDNNHETITATYRPLFTDRTEGKYIQVDLSEQQLYAYEDGNLMHTFPISAGRAPFATPVGEHSVLAKVPYVHYMWNYGPNDPRNYDLGWVQYNLRIYPHIYIHYAYWHNNFGHPMSHGCVNVSYDNMEWVYNWAEEGIPVTVVR